MGYTKVRESLRGLMVTTMTANGSPIADLEKVVQIFPGAHN
jgi:hypothetical protein